MLAVDLIRKGCPPRHPCFALVHQIQAFQRGNSALQCTHIYREANQAADCLAKWGLLQEDRYCVFELAPPFLDLILLADRSSVSFPRGF